MNSAESLKEEDRFSSCEAKIILHLLEVCATQLKTVAILNKRFCYAENKTITHQILEMFYKDLEWNINDPKLIFKRLQRMKLNRDSEYFSNALMFIIHEMKNKRSAQLLEAYVEMNRRMKDQPRIYTNYRGLLNRLQGNFDGKADSLKAEMFELDLQIWNLDKEHMKIRNMDYTTKPYLRKWQQSQLSVAKYGLWQEARRLESAIEKTEIKAILEHQVHDSTMSYLTVSCAELKDRLDTLIAKYELDTQDFDLEFSIVEEEFRTLEEKRLQKEELLVLHAQEIEDYFAYREECDLRTVQIKKYIPVMAKFQLWHVMRVIKQFNLFPKFFARAKFRTLSAQIRGMETELSEKKTKRRPKKKGSKRIKATKTDSVKTTEEMGEAPRISIVDDVKSITVMSEDKIEKQGSASAVSLDKGKKNAKIKKKSKGKAPAKPKLPTQSGANINAEFAEEGETKKKLKLKKSKSTGKGTKKKSKAPKNKDQGLQAANQDFFEDEEAEATAKTTSIDELKGRDTVYLKPTKISRARDSVYLKKLHKEPPKLFAIQEVEDEGTSRETATASHDA